MVVKIPADTCHLGRQVGTLGVVPSCYTPIGVQYSNLKNTLISLDVQCNAMYILKELQKSKSVNCPVKVMCNYFRISY